MSAFARQCLVCGKRTTEGAYCPEHARRRASCRVCGRPAAGAYCELHSEDTVRGIQQPYRSGYADSDYQRARARRFVLANGMCESCGRAITGPWHCHHVVPLSQGGRNVVDNLRVLHTGCHTRLEQQKRTGN